MFHVALLYKINIKGKIFIIFRNKTKKKYNMLNPYTRKISNSLHLKQPRHFLAETKNRSGIPI